MVDPGKIGRFGSSGPAAENVGVRRVAPLVSGRLEGLGTGNRGTGLPHINNDGGFTQEALGGILATGTGGSRPAIKALSAPAPHAPAVPATPAPAGAVNPVEAVVGAGEFASQTVMWAPLALPLFAFLGKVISTPFKWLGNEALANKIHGFMGGVVEGQELMGLGKISAATIQDTIGTRGAERLSRLADSLGTGVDNVLKPYNDGRIKRYGASAEKAAGKLEAAVGKLGELHSAAPHHEMINSHVNSLKDLAQNVQAVDHVAAEKANAIAKGISEAVNGKELRELPSEHRSAFKSLAKQAQKVGKQITTLSEHNASKMTLGNSMRNAATRLRGASTLHVVNNAAMVGMDAFGLYHTASDFGRELGHLADLCVDSKGLAKPPSLPEIAVMDLPPALAAARGELFAKYATQLGIRTLGGAANLRSVVKNGNINFAFWMAQMGAGMLADMAFQDRGLLSTYATLREAQNAGQPLSANDYAALLVAGCKDCQNHKGEANNPVIAELAAYLAENQVKPADVLKMSDNGQIRALIGRIASGEKLASAVAASSVVVPTGEQVAAEAKKRDDPTSSSSTSFADKIARATQPAPAMQPAPASFAARENAPASFAAKEAQRAEAPAAANTLG